MSTLADGPLLVFGPRSLEYDFGPGHPLSPRRFGPGIDLLRAVGAEPGLAPEPATDLELEWLHAPDYVAAVRRFSADPYRESEAGIGPGDDPAFAGMHEAAASVAGGSIRAVEALLRGDFEHAYHPGGGLHHAMRARASGFCIYNDVALAIARARAAGLRVLYVDLDVHHGDGVQALHAHDPGVLTISFHETGRALFPGTGFVAELGEGTAAGTSVNVPLEAFTGPEEWLAAVRGIVPPLAAAFGPDIVVSQHGADGHVWDPLAHLALTTTAMGEAARLVDRIAHRYAGGRWFATGGGGYSVYRVVPRVWALTWLAGAHREAPRMLPDSWRARWEGDAARWENGPLPAGFDDEPGVSSARSTSLTAADADARTVELVRTLTVPTLLRVAEARGWWRPDGRRSPDQRRSGTASGPGAASVPGAASSPRAASGTGAAGSATAGSGAPNAAGSLSAGAEAAIIAPLTREALDRLRLAPRVVAPANPADAQALLAAALGDGGLAVGAVVGERLVGVALAAPTLLDRVYELAALGVAPEWRRRGLGSALLALLVKADGDVLRGAALVALHTVAERDPVEPLPAAVRRDVAERLFRSAGMVGIAVPPAIAAASSNARAAVLLPEGVSPATLDRVEAWLAAGSSNPDHR
ncbi:MAG TPA: acetoin utilization protein AcuC [Candidatus Limnocylindrales bacterium]